MAKQLRRKNLKKPEVNLDVQVKEEEKEIKEVTVPAMNEVIIIENADFDYSELNTKTSSYLKAKELEIKGVLSKAYTDLGRILFEAQEKLAGNNQHDGLFYKWFTSLGFKKDKVYRLISRYKLLVEFCDKQSIIENLPITLAYEISKDSCPEELRARVLDGEIKILKEFREKYSSLQVVETEKEDKTVINIVDITNRISSFNENYKSFFTTVDSKIKTNKIKESKKEYIYKKINKLERELISLMKEIQD